jgi:hypothetical protein
MKLLVVMSIEEHSAEIRKLLREHGVIVFSETDIRGYRFSPAGAVDDRSNWFAHADPAIYSHLFFSVVDEISARNAMAAIGAYSGERRLANPIHAFQLNVEQFI